MKILLIIATLLPMAAALLGGPRPYQPCLTPPEVLAAVKGINEYFVGTDGNGAATRTAVKIISAEKQVVAGVQYTFEIEVTGGRTNEICHVTVWSRLWLDPPNNLRTTVDSCNAKEEVAPSPKGMLVGGRQPADWNDENVQKALSVLVGRINSRSNNFYRTLPTKGDVTKQLVNGMIYRFKNVRMVETSCTKNDATKKETLSLNDCPAKDDSRLTPQLCTGDVYWNFIENAFTLKSFNCEDEVVEAPTPKAMLLGGEKTADWNDEYVQKAMLVLVNTVNDRTNSYHRRLPTRGDVTQQTVNGIIFRFKNLRMVETTCPKMYLKTKETLSFDVCPEKKNAALKPYFCDGGVYWNPRESTPFKLESWDCWVRYRQI